MMKRGWLPAIVLLSCGIIIGSLWASGGFRANREGPQEGAKTDAQPDPDLIAIKATADKYCEAFNAQNSAGLAQLFTDDAEFVDGNDTVVHGKKAIEEAFAGYFRKTAKGKLVIDMDLVRRLAPTALVEEGTYHFEGAGGQTSAAGNSRYVILHVKLNEGWRIASIRCERDNASSGGEQLKQLDWLVGSWVDEGADEVIRSTWKWSEDGNFLLGDFLVESKGRQLMKGTQRLGWDGSRKQIRSWVFDSEGGFVEGFWRKTPSGAWLVKGSGVNSEGETTSQTTVYEPRNKDRFQLTMRDRIDGDEVFPDITVTIIRAFPGPKE